MQAAWYIALLFVSGIIRRNINLLAISLLVIFLYGSMVWGIFPYRPDMSWESHLMGLLTGVALAFAYKHEGPGPTLFISDMAEEDDEDEIDTDPDVADKESILKDEPNNNLVN